MGTALAIPQGLFLMSGLICKTHLAYFMEVLAVPNTEEQFVFNGVRPNR